MASLATRGLSRDYPTVVQLHARSFVPKPGIAANLRRREQWGKPDGIARTSVCAHRGDRGRARLPRAAPAAAYPRRPIPTSSISPVTRVWVVGSAATSATSSRKPMPTPVA